MNIPHPFFLSTDFPSDSDLANLVNIAAIKAAVEGAEKLTAAQLEFAKDRIMMGTERKTMFLSEESKKVCAILFLICFMDLVHIWIKFYINDMIYPGSCASII